MSKKRNAVIVETLALILVVVSARFAFGQEAPRSPRPTTPPLPSIAPSAPDGPPPPISIGPVAPVPMAPPTPKPDDRIALQLKDGSRLVGKLTGLDKLKAKASFGEIAIPLDAILGLRMPDLNNGPPGNPGTSPTILFRNGDVLTAEPILGTLKLETSWGEAAIPGKHIESIVMSTERMAWINDGKWRLVPAATGTVGPSAMPMYPGSPYAPGPYTTPVPFSTGPVYAPPADIAYPSATPVLPTIPSPLLPPAP